jgi:hypothetical protein
MLTAKQNTPLHGFRLLFICLCSCFCCGSKLWAQTPTDKSVDETQVIAAEKPQPPADASATPVPAAESDRIRLEQRQQQLLSELKGPPEAVWVDVDGEKILGFWRQDQSGKPVGAVLLLHAQGQNPRWTDPLLRLHQHLPLHGWATLSIDLPELPEPVIPERKTEPAPPNIEAAPQSTQTAVTDETQVVHQEPDATSAVTAAADPTPAPPATVSITDIRAAIQKRITAATQYLHQQGQYNLVLLGEGAGALWALEHLEQAAVPAAPAAADEAQKAIVDRAIRALILIDARVPEPLLPGELIERLRHPQVPTLDVYTDLGLNARRAAAERKQVSVKAGYQTFVQKRLLPAAGTLDIEAETNLIKTLRGFLQKRAQGVKLD